MSTLCGVCRLLVLVFAEYIKQPGFDLTFPFFPVLLGKHRREVFDLNRTVSERYGLDFALVLNGHYSECITSFLFSNFGPTWPEVDVWLFGQKKKDNALSNALSLLFTRFIYGEKKHPSIYHEIQRPKIKPPIESFTEYLQSDYRLVGGSKKCPSIYQVTFRAKINSLAERFTKCLQLACSTASKAPSYIRTISGRNGPFHPKYLQKSKLSMSGQSAYPSTTTRGERNGYPLGNDSLGMRYSVKWGRRETRPTEKSPPIYHEIQRAIRPPVKNKKSSHIPASL